MSIQLPEEGFLRLKQIIGDRTATPPIPGVFPVGRSSWWRGVREGRYPQPVRLAARTVAWEASAIRALIVTVVRESPKIQETAESTWVIGVPERVCAGCGVTFTQRSRFGHAKYCTRECRARAYQKSRSAGLPYRAEAPKAETP